jgi:heat shock protein HslJ
MRAFIAGAARLLLGAALGAGTLTTVGCASSAAPAGAATTDTLVNTHWRLTQLGDEVVDNPPGERDVHITLQEQNLVVTGNSGCNRMFGHYALDGQTLKFDQMGGTKMFCDTRMELEQKFLEMFGSVAGWKISGKTLQLLDADGKAVATFATT